jgi:hypothetical protein
MKDNLHGHLSTRRIGVTPCSRFDVPSRLYWKPLRQCKLTKLDWSCSGRPFKASHGLTEKLCRAQVPHLLLKQCLLRLRVSFFSRDKPRSALSQRTIRQMDVRRSTPLHLLDSVHLAIEKQRISSIRIQKVKCTILH